MVYEPCNIDSYPQAFFPCCTLMHVTSLVRDYFALSSALKVC